MTYATGGLIQAADYNSVVSTLASQMGVGTGNHGLGQSVSTYPNVTAGNDVYASEWANLLTATNKGLAHEGQTIITVPSSITLGDLITYFPNISTGVTTVYNNTGVSGLALSDSAPSTTTFNGAWGTTGGRTLVFTQTVTFASGDAARYFFNAGGKVKLTFTKSGGSGFTRNTEWAQLATDCGTVTFGFHNTAKVGGGGATPSTLLNSNNGGYWAGTTSLVNNFVQFDNVGSYSTNNIAVQLQLSGTVQNGGYPVLTIKTIWANPWVNAFQDTVDGATATSLVVSSPATTYLTSSWGTPSVGGSVTTA